MVNSKQIRYVIRVALSVILIITAVQPVFAQEQLQQQFENYQENSLQEKLFLHTDKTIYLSGEICWFKIYYVDAFFHRPLDMSKVAYVEVLDKTNKPVLQAKIALKDGSGNGSFHIPVSLVSGNYRLRAYTNWMKNFSAGYFFEKELTVINGRNSYAADTMRQTVLYNAGFFPEGGNLVNGIQSKVAFKLTGPDGKGIACRGIVLNEKGDTVSTYSTLVFGIGSFWLTPKTGHTYKTILVLADGNKITRDLPTAAEVGYAMHLTEETGNQLSITVQSAGNTTAAVYLFAHTRGVVKLVQKNNVQNGATEFMIDKNKLGYGISHFTVFNENRQPVCERLYFKYPEQPLQAVITTDAPVYDTRKQINLQVNTADAAGRPVAADMSMAVYRLDSLQDSHAMDINNYLWLGADLTGTVESPGYYFAGKDAATAEAMDNLMLTHGWRRFRWDDVLQSRKPAFSFLPEYTGHVVNGRIIKTTTGLPVRDIGGYLSVPGTRTLFRNSVSDSAGYIKFSMKDFYNLGEIIVQTDNMQDSTCIVEIQNPFSEKYSGNNLAPLSLAAINGAELQQLNTGVQVQNEFNGSKLRQIKFPETDTTAFYFKPDVSYLLDNYVRFTTMEEVLREYVTPVNVRKRNGHFHLPVFDELVRQFFENDPLVLLDGVPAFDIDKLMQYDPLKIRKLEVVSRRYFLGNMFFEGIVNFVTYKGNLEGYELDPHATVIDYEGLQLQREFYSPVYETPQQINSRLPDFRNLLYWSPAIKTNASGKQAVSFYSSDRSGKYIAVLQGLGADGKTISTTRVFEVKEPPAFTSK